MREYIHTFKQEQLLKLGIDIDESLLLDYFFKFHVKGRANHIVYDGKEYFLMRYKKIIDDIPCLSRCEKKLQRMIVSLERKQVLLRHIKDSRDMYIWTNWDKVFGLEDETAEEKLLRQIVFVPGQNCPQSIGRADNNVQAPGRECPTIVKYNNKDIYILTNTDDGKIEFENLLKKWLRANISETNTIIYDCWFREMHIVDFADDKLTIEFCTASKAAIVRQRYTQHLTTALQDLLQRSYALVAQGALESLQAPKDRAGRQSRANSREIKNQTIKTGNPSRKTKVTNLGHPMTPVGNSSGGLRDGD